MQGIFTTCISREIIDESPMAYKPMDEIVNRITPTAEIVSTSSRCIISWREVSEMVYQISSGREPAECQLGVAKPITAGHIVR